MNAIKELIDESPEIEKKLGYSFQNRSLLALAFIHCSYINEHRDVTEHNERLEFLGDSILGLLISDHLYRNLPEAPEGDLSSVRSKLVDATSCVKYIEKLQVDRYLLLGKGEMINFERGRITILSDLFEAIIGAIYLDSGIESAKRFIFENFGTEIDAVMQNPLRNAKALLQDLCQKKFQQMPTYKVISETGPDHSKTFAVVVFVGDDQIGHGSGSSKKDAQQAAAKDALQKDLW
jgi:ribonuclease III